MALYRIGESVLDLDIVGAGLREGVLPPAPFEMVWAAGSMGFGPRETSDLMAFRAAGWRFLPEKNLNWAFARESNDAPIQPGLLARHPAGGLVVLRDRLVLKLAQGREDVNFERLAERYAEVRQLDFDENLFEVQLRPADGNLEAAIHQELRLLQTGDSPLGRVVFAEPSLLYRVTRPGSFVNEDVPDAPSGFLFNESFNGASPGTSAALDPYPQWQWNQIELDRAWSKGKGKDVRVGVIDLGFHPEDPQITKNVEWIAHLDQDGKLISSTSVPRDWHGTFCAGLIGAMRDGLLVNGAAPEGKLILVALPREGVLSQVGLAEALKLCARGSNGHAGADVITCSLGRSEKNWEITDTLRVAINYVHNKGRSGKGTPVVWAVQNFNERISSDSVVAHGPVISVSQSDQSDRRVLSGYGKALDLIAPGYGVVGIVWGATSSTIYYGWGSSFAAPCVAAAAALVLAAHPGLNSDQVAKILTRSCDRPANVIVPNEDIGWGRLNAKNAVELAIQVKEGAPL